MLLIYKHNAAVNIMRLKIHIINNRKLEYPLNYYFLLMIAVYRFVGKNKKLSFFALGGLVCRNTVFKRFYMSPLKGEYVVRDKKIIFGGDIEFELRSPVRVFIETVCYALFKSGNLTIFDSELEVRMLECYDRSFPCLNYEIKTSSPICIKNKPENHSTSYSSPRMRNSLCRLI